jgi:cyclopropane fatty-acyl-phospholipid synthase-like methyltransferase
MGLTSGHVFLDVGHGIGNACLQAAFTVGCKAKGVELVEARYFASKAFHRSIVKHANDAREAEVNASFSISSMSFQLNPAATDNQTHLTPLARTLGP